MRGILIILVGVLAFPAVGYTTEQIPERIVYEGEERYLASFPLEQYFTEENPKPEWMEPTSTACWRGYVATWKIDGERLYLVEMTREEHRKVNGKLKSVDESVFEKLFPGSKKPLLASWYSGVLQVPAGKPINPISLGFISALKEKLYVSIDKGQVVGRKLVVSDPDSSITINDPSWHELRRKPEREWIKRSESADQEKPENEDWISDPGKLNAKLMNFRSRESFKVRGIIFDGERLWVPPQGRMNSSEFDLEIMGDLDIPESATAVEITATAESETLTLFVTDIRVLPQDAPIQKPPSNQGR
ncbi:MAG: hypothetical protein GWN00_14210 [Aliifodinibius sp.]|nr:hypothetical protein [Fodinibius sp.]NIW40456.1 hypothetical protein [candidate division Zixibacteria bacterium]NIX56373.1 hypothetical protein [candidate division Zixibacteria bacterium]NIY25916.1 hypothetical protein [Fodinibius sp.]